MSDVIPYEDMTNDELARIFASYLLVVGPQGFELPRQMMITELERMSEWLREKQTVPESMNGGRQL